jgi:hypothetical protein
LKGGAARPFSLHALVLSLMSVTALETSRMLRKLTLAAVLAAVAGLAAFW